MFGKFFETMKISASALSAERKRMNIIANNLANINTTRAADGKPYRRKYAVFQTLLDSSVNTGNNLNEKGVELVEIKEDLRPFRKIYKPGHPDADKDGYVALPNVDMVEENVDYLTASRAFGINVNVMKASKDMIKKMLDLMTKD